MISIVGKYNTAICFVGELEPTAFEQIKTVCDQNEFSGCQIRIMPDVHAGMGCTIGTTMTITDKVVPGMVGVDIGCGMETVKIREKNVDFQALDNLIHRQIPSGRDIRKTMHPFNDEIDLEKLRCASKVNLNRARLSIGSLGGGNHFIEIDRNDGGDYYLVVHSGSRHIGNEVAIYYQGAAQKTLFGSPKDKIKKIILTLKAQGRTDAIEEKIKKIKAQSSGLIPKELAYVSGKMFDDYIHDMGIIQKMAWLNRKAMTEVILNSLNLTEIDRFTTIHNYIDTQTMILRKGAVSAKKNQRLLIPINMRDGSLICVGKGNDDWNQSAPHGAGRLMSRKAALSKLSMDEYISSMDGIFTTSVNQLTLDEAPMAYKSMEEIISWITPTVDIVERIRPVYNFKAND
ncbi:MAG: RtcB family protein [Deltaproteobacteria bacterium]|jgi:RNA-splicing ligase RtcB|nr:RtcB family protein [Deltaproteobacteria bacterium]